MRHSALKLLVISFLTWLASAGSAQAQIIWNGGVERGFRPGVSAPFDAEPFSHRYNYGTGSFFYPVVIGNMTGQRLNYLDYADRVERANKFGYPEPADPFHSPPPPPCRTRVGVGFGLFKLR